MDQRICPLAQCDPKAIALAPDHTYGELNQLTSIAAANLSQRNEQFYRIPALPTWQTICFLLAAWRSSRGVILLPPKDYGTSSLPPSTLFEDLNPLFQGTPSKKEPIIDLSSIALLLLTSGSSGVRKLALFTPRQLFESAETVAQALKAKSQDRWLLSLPLHHVAGIGVILRALCSEGTLVLENKGLPYVERIVSAQATFASLVPTQLFRILRDECPSLSTHLLIGGAPLAHELYQRALRRNFIISLTYALTEMSSTVLLTSQPVWKDALPYLGHPLPGREICIKNNEEPVAKLLCPEKSMILRPFARDHEVIPIPSTRPTPCGLGEERECKWPQKGDFNGQMSFATGSELFVRGRSLFEGYGYPPEKVTDWFPTGDLASFHEEFGVKILGRKDFQFQSGGENIQPEEIELALLSLPGVEEAVVVPLFDEEFGARPAAFVKTTLSYSVIQTALAAFLPKQKIPFAFRPLNFLNSLKPNRKELIEEMNNGSICKKIAQLYNPDLPNL